MAGSGMAPLWDHPRGGGGKKRRDNLLFPSLLFCRVGNEGLPRTEKFKDTSRANQKHSSSSPLLLLRQQQRRSCRKGCFFFVGPILRCTSPFNDSSSPSVAATKCSFFPFSLRCKIEASSFYELHFFGTRKKRGEGRGKKPGAKYPQNRSSRISFILLPSPPSVFESPISPRRWYCVTRYIGGGIGGLLWAY